MAKVESIHINTPEPVFSIDPTMNRPIEYKDKDAAILLIMRLILLEPGTFETHPDCGVGLISNYRYIQDLDLSSLENRIQTQIETYLPMFTNVSVTIEIDNLEKILKIYINTDQLNTVIPVDTTTGTITTLGDINN